MVRRRKKQTEPGKTYTSAERQVALQLRNCYIEERRRHINNQRVSVHAYEPAKWQDSLGEESDNLEGEAARHCGRSDQWIRLARKVILKRVDPSLFVRRQFDVLPPNAEPPWPSSLSSKEAWSNFDHGQAISYGQIQVAFRSQKEMMEGEVVLARDSVRTDMAAWADVLLDDEVQLSHLFRYCMALSIVKGIKPGKGSKKAKKDFSSIAKDFKVGAALQYIRDPNSYDKIWGKDWIPFAFREEAAVIYNRVFGGPRSD